ncbi:MAG: transporter substrate-binding domain-containing protein [Catenisphaera adipataccumulans]|jgi:putative glutamine transport system substrate-binding protein|uniref:transporter substrate-binding domain-containing protein n=1 Tax=Catenisphaera adipataccumulans TaxID=700500 RepID=UPI003D8C46F6
MFRKLLAGLLCLCLFCGCSASTTQTSKHEEKEKKTFTLPSAKIIDDIQERGYLIVGVKTDVPGLSDYDETTQTYSGIEIELAYKIAGLIFDCSAKEAESKGYVHFEPVTVANRETKLKNGDIDCLMATYTITASRKKKFALSESYYKDYIGLMVRKTETDNESLGSSGIQSLADLDGKIIGTAKHSTARKATLNYINNHASLSISPIFMEYDSYDELKEALVSGEIDAMCVDVSILEGYVDDSLTILNDRYAPQDYGAAVLPKNRALIEVINYAIEN